MRYWILVVACAGCTRDNPDFIGGDSAEMGIQFLGQDMARDNHPTTDDMAAGFARDLGASFGAPDLAHGTQCTAGQRRCVSSPSTASELCDNGNYAIDRKCPYGSSAKSGADCQSDYCAPPTTDGTTSCDTGGPLEQICSGPANSAPDFTCQPFITNAQSHGVEWWCAIAAVAGGGVAGSACQSGADCRTGYCGSNGTCYWACQVSGDCPTFGMQCSAVTINVEGLALSAPSCVP
jgi:hypothetical protein